MPQPPCSIIAHVLMWYFLCRYVTDCKCNCSESTNVEPTGLQKSKPPKDLAVSISRKQMLFVVWLANSWLDRLHSSHIHSWSQTLRSIDQFWLDNTISGGIWVPNIKNAPMPLVGCLSGSLLLPWYGQSPSPTTYCWLIPPMSIIDLIIPHHSSPSTMVVPLSLSSSISITEVILPSSSTLMIDG